MAGKRPDQHNIAPGEAGASDYKTLPQVGKGNSSEDETTRFDREQVAKQFDRKQEAKSGREPREGEPPAGAAETRTGKENPLA